AAGALGLPRRAAGDRARPGGRAGAAPAEPAGRTPLRARRARDGAERAVAVAAPGQRVVRGKAAGVHVDAGRRVRTGARLARRLPAAFAARGAGDPVADLGPGAPALEPARGALRGAGAVRHLAV